MIVLGAMFFLSETVIDFLAALVRFLFEWFMDWPVVSTLVLCTAVYSAIDAPGRAEPVSSERDGKRK